jgi:homogentisate 1,2-dioxygenase
VPYYVRIGDVPRKRHVLHRDSTGRRLAEELVSQRGFSSDSSLLYHVGSPSALLSAKAVEVPIEQTSPNAAAEPLHLRMLELQESDLVLGRHVLAANSQVSVSWARSSTTSPLYRNARGDELAYVHQGQAVLETVFGSLAVAAGDYVLVPASTTHRWVPEGGHETSVLFVEACGSHIEIPSRYLGPNGQLKEGSPFSERDIRAPQAPLVCEGEAIEVLVRHRAGWAAHVHATHPFDVVGWDGFVYPFALSIRDFEPIVGRLHQPPPVHQTFAGDGFVVCSFVPRPLDFDRDAVPIPYHHANVDSDEVLFYADGDFTSRHGSGIAAGSLTIHPAGFVHGPQPGSVEAALGRPRTDETAVMVDTFSPLALTSTARDVADPEYLSSWLG